MPVLSNCTNWLCFKFYADLSILYFNFNFARPVWPSVLRAMSKCVRPLHTHGSAISRWARCANWVGRCIGFVNNELTFIQDTYTFEGDLIFYYIICINCWMENKFSFTKKFSFTNQNKIHSNRKHRFGKKVQPSSVCFGSVLFRRNAVVDPYLGIDKT